jgi:uncharacterized protein
MGIYMDAPQQKFVFFLILAVVVGMLVGGKVLQFSSNSQSLPILKIGQAEVMVEVADTGEKRSRGLAGRDGLEENRGMWFRFDQPGQYGFWMKGMKFPLDFIWIADNKVVEITESVLVDVSESPKVYQPQQPIDAMLEVNAGWVNRNGVKIGDRVVVE